MGTVENGSEIASWHSEPIRSSKNLGSSEDTESDNQTQSKKPSVQQHQPSVIKTNCLLTASNKRLVIASLSQSALMRNLETSDYDLMIHRCVKSTIFLTGAFKSVSIERCHDCTIIIGSVYSTARLNHCRGCKVSISSRLISLANSSDCVVSVLTPSHPLILSGCRRMTIGPYNTSYNALLKNWSVFIIEYDLSKKSSNKN